MARSFYGFAVIGIAAAMAVVSFVKLPRHFIWNVTDSAPRGLYLVKDDPLQKGGWAVVSSDAPDVIWIADHGFLKPGWPIIKQVAGIAGDEICRTGEEVLLNGEEIAIALLHDNSGDPLPGWSGCHRLEHDEFFLINDHPHSLDGRYFGVVHKRDLLGSAALIWRRS